MERQQWLTMVYREANLLIEQQERDGKPLTAADINGLEPEIHQQIQEVLQSCGALEDLIKHSVLKNPKPSVWENEDTWERVLIAVASECLMHDVSGVAMKILAGDLPRMASHTLHDPV